jgi:hypothetical protein
MTDHWYLYINKDTMQVCRVSPSLEEDDTYIVQIEAALGISFIESPHTINDYVVYHDGSTTHFIKKEKSADVLIPFYYSPQLIAEDVENPVITVYLLKDELQVTLSPELTSYALTLYGNMPKGKQHAEFYISAKNDPNKLLEIMEIDMLALARGGIVRMGFNHDPQEVSIFTRKVFDSYGLKIIQ